MAAVSSDSAADESLLVDDFEQEIIHHLHEPHRLFPYLGISLLPFDVQKTVFHQETQLSNKVEAVRIMLNCLKNSGLSWFRKFKEALLHTGNRTLYKILNMEEVDTEKYTLLFYHYYVKFTSDVNAREITQHLLSRDILKKEDMEEIHAVDNNYGNSRAMMKLIFTLHDRDDKWFVHLVAATRECGYLLDDINPHLKEAETDRSVESIINRQAAALNSENQALGRRTERDIPIKTDECRRMRSEAEGTVKSSLEPESRSRDHECLNIESNEGEFDFRSCLTEEHVRTGTSRTCDAATAAAAAVGGSDGDDWRKMKIESSNVNDLTYIQGSHARTFIQQVPVKQDPVNAIDHLSLQATKIKTSSESDDLFSEIITNIMQKIAEQLSAKCNRIDDQLVADQVRRRMMTVVSLCERRGSCSYKRIVEKLENEVQKIYDQTTRDYLWSCLRRLRIYNNALMINTACRPQEALEYINDQLSTVRRGLPDAEISDSLDKLYFDNEGCLKEISRTPGVGNVRLESDVLRRVDGEDGGQVSRRRGVVLCDSDEVAEALLRWMKRGCKPLAALNPAKLNLPTRKAHSGEFCTAADAEELFSRGHRLLVAVSSTVDVKELSRCCYTIDHTINSSSLPDDVSLPSTTVETSVSSDSSACSSLSTDSTVYELRCSNCHADSTRSTELRLINEHCVTLDKGFADRAVFEEYVRAKTIQQHWRKKDKIKCGKCLSDWGVRALYKDHSYNVLTAVSFEMLDPNASLVGPFKSWNDAPFKIKKMRHRPKVVSPTGGR